MSGQGWCLWCGISVLTVDLIKFVEKISAVDVPVCEGGVSDVSVHHGYVRTNRWSNCKPFLLV